MIVKSLYQCLLDYNLLTSVCIEVYTCSTSKLTHFWFIYMSFYVGYSRFFKGLFFKFVLKVKISFKLPSPSIYTIYMLFVVICCLKFEKIRKFRSSHFCCCCIIESCCLNSGINKSLFLLLLLIILVSHRCRFIFNLINITSIVLTAVWHGFINTFWKQKSHSIFC